MPREYRQGTPAGDPTNPLSLVSSTVDIQQFTYTPQTAVAEPENQYAQLLKILELGGAAAQNVMDYKTQVIENNMAVTAAINRQQESMIREQERATEQAERQAEKMEYKREVAVRKEQDGIVNFFDAQITSALLNDDYETAEALGNKFSGTYPVDQNPYMNQKAQDQLLRIRNAKRVYDSTEQQKKNQFSGAIRGAALYDIMKELETLEGTFANPETRQGVMDIVDGGIPTSDGGVSPRIPNEQLHTSITEYLMNKVPTAKDINLSEEDRVEIGVATLRMSQTLRNGIIQERNRRDTFRKIEMRYNNAVYLVSSMNDPTKDMPGFFAEFDALSADEENGFLTKTQRENMERNLSATAIQGLGRESPISGALSYADMIEQAVLDGNIPANRGQSIVAGLRKRAATELQGKLGSIDAEAKRNSTSDTTYLYEAYPISDPTTDMGITLGVYRINEQGNVEVLPGREKLQEQLKRFSDRWVEQEAAYSKQRNVRGNIATVDGLVVLDNELRTINNAVMSGEIDVDQSLQYSGNLVTQEMQGYMAYKSDPRNQEKYAVSLKRVSDAAILAHNNRVDPSKMVTLTLSGGQTVTVDPTIAQNEDFRMFADLASTNNLDGLESELMRYRAEGRTNNTERRMVWMHGVSMLMERRLTDTQRAMAANPFNARLYTKAEIDSITTVAAEDLYKRGSKMTAFQREVEEDKTARMVATTGNVPEDWLKYVSERYFAKGGKATPDQLRQGYLLLTKAKGTVVDGSGIAMNFAPFGNTQAEIRMQQLDPVMYETVVIAEGLALGTDRTVDEFLDEAYAIAVDRNARLEASKGPAKYGDELIPPMNIDPQTGLPKSDARTLFGQRMESLRTAFSEVYGTDIPRTSEYGLANDPYFSMDVEDYNRMNAFYQSFKRKGYPTEIATKMAVRNMHQIGYRLIVPGNNQGTDTAGSTSVMMVYDPYGNVPSADVMEQDDWKLYMNDVASIALRQPVNLGTPGGYKVFYGWNNDYSRPDSSIPTTLIDSQGNRMEIPQGVSYQDFLRWQEDRSSGKTNWKGEKVSMSMPPRRGSAIESAIAAAVFATTPESLADEKYLNSPGIVYPDTNKQMYGKRLAPEPIGIEIPKGNMAEKMFPTNLIPADFKDGDSIPYMNGALLREGTDWVVVYPADRSFSNEPRTYKWTDMGWEITPTMDIDGNTKWVDDLFIKIKKQEQEENSKLRQKIMDDIQRNKDARDATIAPFFPGGIIPFPTNQPIIDEDPFTPGVQAPGMYDKAIQEDIQRKRRQRERTGG